MLPIEAEAGRQRKAHTKSRSGCKNCKIRRIKCDETKPQCNKCLSYGVSCNYDGKASDDLQLPGEGAFVLEPPVTLAVPPPTPPSEVILGLLGSPLGVYDSDEPYTMTAEDIDLLLKFQNRTVFTVGTAQTVHAYRDFIVELGAQHDFLTHITLTLVLMHDRNLADGPYLPPSTKESFHHYHGTAIFHAKLKQPVKEEDKDAMWASAALLGAVTFASIEATTADDCWPLAADSPSDLDWLRMSDGKKEVWRLTNPMREGSAFRPVMQIMEKFDSTPDAPRDPQLDRLFPFLTRLYSFDEAHDANGDPYHTATSILVRLLPIRCSYSTIMYFLSFMGHMDPAYRQLLHEKDAKALLLLAWWFAKLLEWENWWITRRAKLECRAICIWLNSRYMPYSDVGQLLDYPKAACGLSIVRQNYPHVLN